MKRILNTGTSSGLGDAPVMRFDVQTSEADHLAVMRWWFPTDAGKATP
jgi:hypothetical protein